MMPRSVAVLTGLLLAVGIAARLSSLVDPAGRMLWQYVTEDGYLMQTVARNLALGLGMTVSDGSIATNGVQPLATLLYAGMHWLAGGAKEAAIALVIVLSTAVALCATRAVHLLGTAVFRDSPVRAYVPLLAALWFASPLVTRHSMNGLETGLYYALLAATMAYYLHKADAPLRPARRVTLGLLLGLTFLARNDAVFFIAALLAVHVTSGLLTREAVVRRVVDAFVAGSISIVVALPWLASNYTRFGSIVPISGSAQSLQAGFGANAMRVPANLLEASLLYLPIPGRLEGMPAIALVSGALFVLVAYAFWTRGAAPASAGRRLGLTAWLFAIGLCGYYGFFFGAPHFLSRYLSSLTPFLWLIACGAAFALALRTTRAQPWVPHAAGALSALLLAGGAFAAAVDFRRGFNEGSAYMHRQVVEWVTRNVRKEEWVAAVQTGALGYFHDRTINLDGKVNPAALRERRERGHVQTYVVGDERIRYLADWAGIAKWPATNLDRRFSASFEVLVEDSRANLGVLARRSGSPVR